jgi:phage baseplate assembly protein W
MSDNYIIARTSWVFGGGKDKDKKFVAKLVSQLDKSEVKAVNDQFSSPTYAKDLVGALKNLILTGNYERPFHSEIGSPIRKLLFEPAYPMLGAMLKRTIQDVITSFEPRVNIIDIICVVASDDQTINVTIEFTILNTTAPITLDLTLQRTR